MKNLIQYSSKTSNLFFDFTNEKIEQKELINKLYKIESYHREKSKSKNSSKGLWFKFSKYDTLCTTIKDLNTDLIDGKNKDFTISQLKNAISLQGELQIYFS